MKIAAVIVTFNRIEYLKECIRGIRLQTLRPDKIFVVNNSSTDGTLEWLKNEADLDVITQPNWGSAGGQHTAINAAYSKGYDWIWCMDDDVEPENNCLETLISYKHISKCIHPRRKYLNGEFVNWEGYFNIRTLEPIFNDDKSFASGSDFCKVNQGCFEGMLIHKEVISKIGLPLKEFFMVHDDLLYGYLASQVTDVLYVKNAVIIRKIIPNKILSNNAIYFYIKNHFLLHREMNRIAPGYHYERTISYFRVMKKLFVQVLVGDRMKRFYLLILGLFHGITNNNQNKIIENKNKS